MLLIILLVIVLKIPSVQNNLAQRATQYINKKYNTSIVIDKIDLANLGDIKLKGIVIKDHHNYPFIKIVNLQTSLLNYKKIIDNELLLGDINLYGLDFALKTYKGENQDNISIFSDRFDSGKKSKKPFLLTANKIKLKNSTFYLFNENKQIKPVVFYKNLNANISKLKVEGVNIYAKIKSASFIDNHNIEVTNFKTDFTYTRKQMLFDELLLKTKKSNMEMNLVFDYEDGLSDFNNKVQIKANIKKASVSLKDLHHFYSELGQTDKIHFTTKFKGTLNDFKLKRLRLVSNQNSIINGNLHFINVLNKEKGFSLQANISNLTSDYDNLKKLLPNLLGKTLPSSFAKLGRFTIKGKTYITNKKIDAQLEMQSDLGTSISDLKLGNINDIDKATYIGKIEFIDFELGKIIKDPLVGQLSMIADVDGKGFTKATLNTSVIGKISKHQYKGYTYSNIDINGIFKDQHFNGDMVTNDKNIKMTFKGLADLSSSVNSFKFKADVDYANFNKLNLFKVHDISILKGKIDIDITGSSIDNIVGKINFKDASYTNQIDLYKFKNFDVISSFKDSVRTITVNSKDIIDGRLKGKFKFAELPKLAKNSLGSIYTHYRPDSVSTGQFLDFKFKIYDKIIGVFYPKVKVGKNTSVKGKINSDNEIFELTFKSPKVEAYENILEKIRLQIDNKNPLFNTILSVNKIDTKHYNLAELNLVNVTLNDTLYIQSDFVGGKELKEKYNLSLYHTINKQNRSVVGFKKSDFEFKNQKWLINEFNNNENKIVFDANFKNFDLKEIKIISDKQEFKLSGLINDKLNKNIHLNFKNILLDKITPKINNLILDGLVNGTINYKQKNGKTLPIVDLSVQNFTVNDFDYGFLMLNAKGDKTLKKYNFYTELNQQNNNILVANGMVDLNPENPIIDANINLDKLNLEPYTDFGGNAISNIRGDISGNIKLKGLLENPKMKGNLSLNNVGLGFPYLNVDYFIKDKLNVSLKDQTFTFEPATLVDTEMETEGFLTGSITHNNFKKWFLDLKIIMDDFLVLNTKEDEENPYFGTAFIEGEGTIVGFTDALTIDVMATTNQGTEFIVPLSDVNTIEENKLVHFITNHKKGDDIGRPDNIVFDKKGLTLIFDLAVTPDAVAEIVIDKATGSVLRGRGDAFLDIEINTNGKFEMNGVYIVDSGQYQFKNIISKKFTVKQGGKITWNGSPFDAFLDIEAINKVKANPSILLENIQGTRDIDVDLSTKITGNLYEPIMAFDINLPNASSIVQSELAFKINDEDKKMTQFFSLLGTGTFFNLENADFGNSGSSLLAGTLSERISSAISNILRSDNDKIQIGVSLEIGDENKLNNLRTDDQVGVTFETRISKKIIVNGVVGIPLGSDSQSSITGEIEIAMPLNKAENFKAKVYNRRNEVQFDVLDTEGYTQGVGLSYQFNWDTGSEFLEKTGLKRSKEQKESLRLKREAKKRRKDSILKLKKSSGFVNFLTKKKDTLKL